jgi:hypothetical protein
MMTWPSCCALVARAGRPLDGPLLMITGDAGFRAGHGVYGAPRQPTDFRSPS